MMAKAILELEMPESCRGGCPFYKITDICDILSSWNHHWPVYTPSEGRRLDCPLKLVKSEGGCFVKVDKLQEIIDFFELEEGYDKEEIISEIIREIKGLKGYYEDEIGLEWDGEYLMTLDDFANEFYNKLIEKVCNVIKSFQNE